MLLYVTYAVQATASERTLENACERSPPSSSSSPGRKDKTLSRPRDGDVRDERRLSRDTVSLAVAPRVFSVLAEDDGHVDNTVSSDRLLCMRETLR